MIAAGVVVPAEAPGRGAVYRLPQHLRETKAFLASRAARLRDHFAHHPQFRNADYREWFGITRAAARHELKRLVDLGFLKMEGVRRGARYLPGPELR